MFEKILGAVAGPLIGGLFGSDSAEDASRAQGESTAAAIAEQRRQYDLNRADLAPYRDTGGAAVSRIGELLGLGTRPSARRPYLSGQTTGSESDLLAEYNRRHVADQGMTLEESLQQGLTTPENYERILGQLRGQAEQIRNPMSAEEQDRDYGALNRKFTLADFWDDPVTKASYEFGLNEGTKALDRMGGARGMRNSGQQLKALTRFGTDYTGQKAGESYNRFYGDQDRDFNRLAGVAGVGQTAATNTANMGQGTANNVSGLLSAQGNARGAAAIAGGNAWGNAGAQIGNNLQQQSTLDKILNSRAGGYGNYSGYSGYQGNSNPYLMSNTVE